MGTRRSTRIPLANLPLKPSDRGGTTGSPHPAKVTLSSSTSTKSSAPTIHQTQRTLRSHPTPTHPSSSADASPARRLFAQPASSSSYGFGTPKSPRSLTPRLEDVPSSDPPSPFLVTALRSPTPYPNSPVLNPSSTPTTRPRTPTRRGRSNTPSHVLPPLQADPPATPSTSTGPGTAGCGFDIFHDDEPINGATVNAFASSSSSLFPSDDLNLAGLAASPAPSGSSAFEDYQPDKENKAPAMLTSYPLMPSPLKRRRDVLPEPELDEDGAEPLPASAARGSPVKGWKGKGKELIYVPEEDKDDEKDEAPTVLASVKGKGKGKGKGRAILELEADEGDLMMGENDKGLELTPGRRVVGVTVAEKKRVVGGPGGSPGKKRRGE